MGRTRTTAGLQSSAQGNPSDTSHCPARDDAEGYLADAEATPTALLQLLQH